MKMIYNLKRFVLEEIMRPYQTMIGFDEKRITESDFKLFDVIHLLEEHKEWKGCVFDRLRAIQYCLPMYIKHPIVNYLHDAGVIRRVEVN
jgi:hypothetical protein